MEQVTEVTSFKKVLVSTVIFVAFLGMLVAFLGIISGEWKAFIVGIVIAVPGAILGRKQIKEIAVWIIFSNEKK